MGAGSDTDGDGEHTGEGIKRTNTIVSKPPPGKCRIVNAYWDPDLQRAIFEYNDEPEE